MKKVLNSLTVLAFLAMTKIAMAEEAFTSGEVNMGWTPPTLGVIIGFMIKFLFFFAGLAALLYLLLGAFAWVTSSGDKENLKKAQDKIQAAVLGLVILVVVVVILATLEQLVLKNTFCVGLTCTISVPSLLPK